jgi:hypothetical protein
MNQHFVPRAYLKNFAKKVKNDYYIEAFDKIKQKHFRVNIKKVCAETNLYTMPDNNSITKDILAIEKMYSHSIEPMYLRAYKALINNNIFQINDLQRTEIITGALHFHMRNPRILRRSLAIHSEEIKLIYNEAKLKNQKGPTYFDEDFSFKQWTQESISQYFMQRIVKEFKERHIISTIDILKFQNDAIIEINIARDKANFITGDNPLAMEDFFTKSEQPYLKSTEFVLPLNKRFLLKLYHDNRKSPNLIYRSYVPDGNVNMANQLVFDQSSTFVFGDESDFKEFFKMRSFLANDSMEMKIDMIRQLLEVIPENDDNRESRKVLREYYTNYQKNSSVTSEDEQAMFQKIKQLSADFKRKIIA